jgi:hypothetical protein
VGSNAVNAEDVFAALREGKDVEVAGFGTFNVKEYSGYAGRNPRTGKAVAVPGKKVVIFTWAPECLAWLRRETETVPSVAAPELRAIIPVLREVPGVAAWGNVGRFLSQSFGGNRVRVTFSPSNALRAALRGEPLPKELPSTKVAKVLARYPEAGVLSFDEASAAVARLGLPVRKPATQEVHAVEGEIGVALPALLRRLLETHDVHASDSLLPARMIADASEFGSALRDHRAFMAEIGQEPGVPFAVEANGDSWCFCTHPAEHGESWVFLAGPDATLSSHQHALTFGRWLTVSLLLAELEATAGEEKTLAASEAEAVFRYLHRLAPSATTLYSRVPY